MTQPSTALAALAALVAAGALVAATSAHASVPERLYFQGHLTLADGSPVSDSVDLEVRLYDGGDMGAALLWSDTLNVDVEAGAFDMFLGDNGTPLPPSALAGIPAWLELTVDGDLLEPRMEVASVPYAYSAAEAELCEVAIDATTVNGFAPEAFASAAALAALQAAVDALEIGGGTGPGGCIDECAAEGATGCTAGLDAVWRCQDTEDGDACLDKVLETTCAPGTVCDLTTKQCECGLSCTIGEPSCASPTASALCDDSDGDGCPTLVATPCSEAEKCDGPTGACVCTNETGCNDAASVGCTDNTPFKCADLDGDGCLERVMLAPCAATDVCAAGSCGCKNTCAVAGQRGCDGTKVWTCTDANGDGCLDRQPVWDCGGSYLCIDGECECKSEAPSSGTCLPYDVGRQTSGSCQSFVKEVTCPLGQCSQYLGACEDWRAEVLPLRDISQPSRLRFVEHEGAIHARLVTYDSNLYVWRASKPGWVHTLLDFTARDVWGTVEAATGALHIFVVGDDGKLAHHDGSGWKVHVLGSAPLRAVHGVEDDVVVAAGDDASVFYRSVVGSGPWSKLTTAGQSWADTHFRDVHVSTAALAHLVGTGGRLLEMTILGNGTAGAIPIETGTTKELTAVLRLGENPSFAATFVGGVGYYAVKPAGGTWSASPETAGTATDVWGSIGGGAWFARSSSVVRYLNGTWDTVTGKNAATGAVSSTGARTEALFNAEHSYWMTGSTASQWIFLNEDPLGMVAAPIGDGGELVELHGDWSDRLFERRASNGNLWELSDTDGSFANDSLNLTALWAHPEVGHVAALGDGLLAFHDGTAWHNEYTLLALSFGLDATEAVRAYGATAGDVRFAAVGTKCLLREPASAWETMPCPKGTIESAVVSAADDIWAEVGSDLMRWNGSEWMLVNAWKTVWSSDLNHVAGYGSTDLWVVGTGAIAATYDGGGFATFKPDWKVQASPWWPQGWGLPSDSSGACQEGCRRENWDYYGSWAPSAWPHPTPRPEALLNPRYRNLCGSGSCSNTWYDDRAYLTVLQGGAPHMRRVPRYLTAETSQPAARGISGFGERVFLHGTSAGNGFLVSYDLGSFAQ